LRRAELLDLTLETLGGLDELFLLLGDLRVLGLEIGQLLADGGPSGERLPGQVLVPLAEGGLGLLLELVGLLLELGGLELDPLPRRRDVGHAAPDLGQALHLLLVREVERVSRVLDPVQDLVRLGLKDRRHSTEHTH